jgi:ArsR family transcriptional regulator
MKKLNLSIEALSLVAERFRTLSEPQRLQILQSLHESEKSVNSLAAETGANQPNVSKHLKALLSSGIVKRRQSGNTAFYSIADESVWALCDVVCNSLRQQFEAQALVMK